MGQRQMRELATAKLVDLLQEISTTAKAMTISPEALRILETFEEKFSVIREDENDLALVAQRDRLVNSAWKISLLYQMDLDPHAPIGKLAMEKACELVPLFWSSFRTVFGLCGGEVFTRLYLKVWQRITAAGEAGIRKRDLGRTFFRHTKDYTAVLEQLVKTEAIRITSGRPSMIYVLEPRPEAVHQVPRATLEEALGVGFGEPN
jgi:hypothetical protein